jgi:hypothetical protein
VTIGLGKATHVDAVEILWPTGTIQKLGKSVKLNQTVVVREGQ